MPPHNHQSNQLQTTQRDHFWTPTAHRSIKVAAGGGALPHDGARAPAPTLQSVLDAWSSTPHGAAHGHVVFERAKVPVHDDAATAAAAAARCSGDDDASSTSGSAPASTWLDRGGAAMADDLGWVANLGVGAPLDAGSHATNDVVLSAAPRGCGLPRHTHGASWFALAVGTKVGALRRQPCISPRPHLAWWFGRSRKGAPMRNGLS